jgi:outer membrane protein assembly factor BamB
MFGLSAMRAWGCVTTTSSSVSSRQAHGIFLSYRRQDSSHLAGRLADALIDRFGSETIFMDVDSVPLGRDFVEAIDGALSQSSVLLAVIGPLWRDATDKTGRRRIDDPRDIVVLEISSALSRGLTVIPVLADGAQMPGPDELPERLRPLSTRNAVSLDAVSFHRDVDWLLRQLGSIVPADPMDAPINGSSEEVEPAGTARFPRRKVLAGAGATLVAVTAGYAVRHGQRDAQRVRTRWRFTTRGAVYSSPRIDGQIVYVGSNDGRLYALDRATGKQRWGYQCGGGVSSTPLIQGSIVYVGSDDQSLHAVDKVTGKRRWIFKTKGVVHSSPSFGRGLVVVGSRDRHVYAVDAESGAEMWRFEGGDWFNSSPVLTEDAVYVGCRDHQFYALELETGKKLWSYTTKSTVDSSASVEGATLAFGSDDGFVYSLETSGAWHWQTQTGGGVVSRPLLVDEVGYVGSDDGRLYAFDTSTGRIRWSFKTGGGIRSSPAYGRGLVCVGSRDRRLYAVNAVTGREEWRFETDGPIDDSSPVIAEDVVLVGSLDHRVYAIEMPRG